HKLTETGIVVGTPAYIPPEYARGEKVDFRADIYGVGCIMYEALAGNPPFTGANYNALLHAVQHREPPPIERRGLSDDLLGVIRCALAKNPADRYATAGDMQ